MKLSQQAKGKRASPQLVKPHASHPCRELLLDLLHMLPTLSGKFCPFCKVHHQIPVKAHKPDCTWRRAEEWLDSEEAG
jgi:hypothetical protein